MGINNNVQNTSNSYWYYYFNYVSWTRLSSMQTRPQICNVQAQWKCIS